ncbi:MAG: hypothetical protein AAGC88_04400 [Bacteroidota bacterium]
MKLPLSEIWEFLDLLEIKSAVWQFDLIAGEVVHKGLSLDDVVSINEENDYDVELLPSIFTYREILWQPNVYAEPQNCLPSLNLLEAYCKEFVAANNFDTPRHQLYNYLLTELASFAAKAVSDISVQDNPDIARILGDLRNRSFPIIKFFIWHPRNRPEHVQDALKRLNYTVKILLTQYHNNYGQLSDPYWEITKSPTHPSDKTKSTKASKPDAKASAEESQDERITETESSSVMTPSSIT